MKFPTSEDYFMSSSLVLQFADETVTFAKGRVLGHTGLPLYESSFETCRFFDVANAEEKNFHKKIHN